MDPTSRKDAATLLPYLLIMPRKSTQKSLQNHQAERNRVNVAAWRERQEKKGKKPITTWVSIEAAAVLDEFCTKTGKSQSAGLDLLLRSIDIKAILDAKKAVKKKFIHHKILNNKDIFEE